MITVSDYIFKILKEKYDVKHVFVITGGGAMYLNNALLNSGIEYICFHNEQALAYAAEGYARATGKMAVCLVTTGPGGLNCLSGVMGQWTDSIPVLYISGQVNFQHTKYYHNKDIRQVGDQETNIIDIVRPIVKNAEVVDNEWGIKMQLKTAISIACNDRPGPVWLDIPLNIQKAEITINI